MKENQREKEIYKVTIVGALANVTLLIFKFVAGIISNSAAMIADAVHSLSDFITDVVVIVFVKISSKPQDKSHDYGHGKFETLATLIIGIALLFIGLMILYNGASATYRCIWLGEELHRPGMIAFWAAIFSIILKEAVYQYTVFKGKNLNSQAVIANAWHHRSDAFSSIGTAVGIGGAIFLGDKWVVLDPIAAIVVSVFIINVSLKIIIKVAESFDMVKDVHDLRTRRIGNNIAIEMHLLMDGNLSLQCTHNTTELIESELRKKYGEHTHIAIHVEPF